MRIQIESSLPKKDELPVEGVPEEFLQPRKEPLFKERKGDQLLLGDFEYTVFYDELKEFHEKYCNPNTDEEWTELVDLSETFWQRWNQCRTKFHKEMYMAVMNDIERRYCQRHGLPVPLWDIETD